MRTDMTPSPIGCRAGGKGKRRVGTTPSANTASDKWLALAIIMNALGEDEDDDNDGDENDGETLFICHRAVKRSSRPRSLGSRSRRLNSSASANHSLLQATTAR